LHDAACEQLMPLRHDPSALHMMSHLYPAGQVIWPAQLVIWQLIVHVFCAVLQVVHPGGQLFWLPPSGFGASPRGFGASTVLPARTQKPSLLHTRPLSQSVLLVQAY
jgi:hypothetical protein